MNRQRSLGPTITRLQTVDQRGLSRTNNFAGTVAWLVAGFNLGIFLMLLLALVILPALVSDFSIHRKKDQPPAQAISYVLITNTPLPTATFTAVPTLEPVATTTPAPTFTASPVVPVVQSPSPTQLVITLANAFSGSQTNSAPAVSTSFPASYEVTGIKFVKQGWNNCGPANLAMGLSFYGWQGTQNDTASYLKPEREDRNVSPQQMIDYVNTHTQLKAIWRMAGTLDQIRWLVSNRFVVIAESGYDPGNGEGWYGHYEIITGYDDSREMITVYDSYLGSASRPALTRSYEIFNRDWQAFNRNYIVIYESFREYELSSFLGSDWVEQDNRRDAAEVAQREAAENPDNPFAWFNLGTSLTSLGRYEEAVTAFQQASQLSLPYRMMWYQFGMYEALLQTGRLPDVLTLVNATHATRGGEYVEETYYYQGRVFEIQGDYASAIDQYNEALALNPNFVQAQIALQRVGG